ncbi:hypothetical protein QYM36_004312 [Artemia franciscana]|uniref:Uncharacterized protein n=1 Tax=Artemia franciscana TaxID=6661 RepID=A0AA88L6L4_ARTSF|nr:hypothetical protein QYM36_004312 [Artemia franciscana]
MSQKESKGWNDPPITAGTAPRKPFKRPKAPPHPLLRGQEGSSPAGSQNPPLPLARNLPPSEILSRLVPGVKNSSKEEDVSIGGNCNIEDKLENVSVKMSSSPDIKEELRNLLKEMSSDEDIDKNALLNLERLLQGMFKESSNSSRENWPSV